MKAIKITASLIIFITLQSLTFAQKTGYINRDAVFNDMPQTKEALRKLQKAQKEYTDYIQQLKNEYKEKLKELKLKQDSLPKIIVQEKVQELNNLDKKISDFQAKAQKDLLTQKEKLLTPPKDKLNKAIEEVRKQKGYDNIIDNSTYIIISTNHKFDIESEVRKKLGLN